LKFGDNLRKLRKMKKLSQENLAEKMNVSRQSVSKWETGDAYPEMNNILELCKIFHCNINDLVNDSFIDIDSLDEEVCKIICIVSIPAVIASMLILGILISKIDIKNNEIILKGNDIIKISEVENKITLTVNNKVISDTKTTNEIFNLKELINKNSKIMIFAYIETGFVFLVINLALIIKILKALESLFNNINKGDTPFTLENVNYIKKMAYLMIAVTVLPNIVGILFETVLKTNLHIGFEMFNIIEILFLFSIAYIFQYGYEIQLDSKGKMYGITNE